MTPPRSLSRRLALSGMVVAVLATGLAACTPTIRLEVAPIQINATLDANVRIKLDKELQDLLRENPNLF
ncbi:MAG: YnbE family lipoprotein [Brevundimonas sp.]|nr:YnbE family lipoprotein [Brevundimonas sp.]